MLTVRGSPEGSLFSHRRRCYLILNSPNSVPHPRIVQCSRRQIGHNNSKVTLFRTTRPRADYIIGLKG